MRQQAFWQTGCGLWSTIIRCSWWKEVFTGSLHVPTSHLVQKEVCV